MRFSSSFNVHASHFCVYTRPDCPAQCSGVLPTLTALLALSQRACLKQQQVQINPAWHIQPHS